MRHAVVLLSGGLDSAVTLALCKRDGFEPHALSFEYGQRHAIEIAAAQRVAASMHVQDHRIATIDLRVFGGSALTDEAIEVPRRHSERSGAESRNPVEAATRAATGSLDFARDDGIPVTYVPARNTIFLSYALAFAEVIGASDIFIGVNAVDYSGYPDCRPEFLAAFQQLAGLATKAGVQGKRMMIRAPLLALSKAEIVREGVKLGVDFALTHSCYAPAEDRAACGCCDSCQLRLAGFREAGVKDPIRYV
ncbi:MAG: 7-cyano-7-deazaguanine synthase QueC [Chthoniobacterales bacterium]